MTLFMKDIVIDMNLTTSTEMEITDKGMVISGQSPDDKLVEMVEIPNHPWYIGVQFHPEFKSRPNRPHPLFASFIKAALDKKNKAAE